MKDKNKKQREIRNNVTFSYAESKLKMNFTKNDNFLCYFLKIHEFLYNYYYNEKSLAKKIALRMYMKNPLKYMELLLSILLRICFYCSIKPHKWRSDSAQNW